jgi:hypothetical protein
MLIYYKLRFLEYFYRAAPGPVTVLQQTVVYIYLFIFRNLYSEKNCLFYAELRIDTYNLSYFVSTISKALLYIER